MKERRKKEGEGKKTQRSSNSPLGSFFSRSCQRERRPTELGVYVARPPAGPTKRRRSAQSESSYPKRMSCFARRSPQLVSNGRKREREKDGFRSGRSGRRGPLRRPNEPPKLRSAPSTGSLTHSLHFLGIRVGNLSSLTL